MNKSPIIEKDDLSREYFTKYARKYYGNFIEYVEENYCDYSWNDEFKLSKKDCVFKLLNAKDVHHIFPLVYGGDNSLQNLIHISNYTHKILHMNPLEKIKKYCYQAIDYMYWMCNYNLINVYEKYNIFNLCNNDVNIASKLILNRIEEEMLFFYNYLKNNTNNYQVINS